MLTTLLALTLAAAPDEATLVPRINSRLAQRWEKAGATPAPFASAAEYHRRARLDLTGRVPTPDEARAFLDDRDPGKRAKLIDALLKSPQHAAHFTAVWRDLLVPEAANAAANLNATALDDWLRTRFAANARYDGWVRELLTLPFTEQRVTQRQPKMAREERPDNAATPRVFYEAKEAKPENLAAATARLFLGVRIECAQCHDHPSGRWTRAQFWSYAAFFAGLYRETSEGNVGQIKEVFDRREMAIPGSSQVTDAAFLDDKTPRWKFNVGARATLAEWLTASDNPFFARAAVNRVWEQLTGTGLIDPVDDFHDENPPSHPDMLDELAGAFVQSGYDLRFLIRVIAASDAYQRTSAAPASDPRLFARQAVRGLTAGQLFDSIAAATGLTDTSRRAAFLGEFATGGVPLTQQRLGIQQALTLMNGRLVRDLTKPGRDYVKVGVFAQYFKSFGVDPPQLRNELNRRINKLVHGSLATAGRVEELYLATLSRRPTPAESAKLVKFVHAGDAAENLGTVLWLLLNSPEFLLNH